MHPALWADLPEEESTGTSLALTIEEKPNTHSAEPHEARRYAKCPFASA